MNFRRETTRLNAVYSGHVLGLHCDVTQEEAVQGMINKAADFGGGRIDILFNNAGAGFSGGFRPVDKRRLGKGVRAEFLRGAIRHRAVRPIMRAQGSGHIIDIISGIAFMPMAQQSMYSATKAALNGLALAIRYELWDENIRVTSARRVRR
jgi:NAD(P)-dependent dehydrogenase (short-subunit alcohol dehydrogenase family)